MGYVKRFKVNMLLLPLKVHYFLFMAALAAVLPFRTVIAKQLGISATAVGVIFLAIPFFKLVGNPLFGLVVDYFKKFRLTIAVLMVIVAVTHVSMVFIPPMEGVGELQKHARNLRVTLEYDCSEVPHRPFLRVHSSFQEDNVGSSNHLSCKITCQKGLLSPQKYVGNGGSCEKGIGGSFQMNLETSDRRLKFSISNESFVTLQNSSLKLTELTTRVPLQKQQSPDEECPGKRKCFGNVHQHLEKNSSTMARTYATTKFNASLNAALNSSEVLKSVSRLLTAQGDFSIEVTDPQTNCDCRDRVECVTVKCHRDPSYPKEAPEDEFLSLQFWSLFVLISASSVTFCAVLFLMDTVCYEMLGEGKEDYGLQRLWGTIGWGLGALAGGYLNQLVSEDLSNIDYSLSFYLLAVLVVVDLIPVFKLQVEDIQYSPHICKDVCSLLARPRMAINVAMVFAIGVLSGLMWNYQFWFMEEIGASQVLLGLSQTIECLFAELPCFFVSGWVIRKLGYENCNSLALLCFGLRYAGFAYMWDPWMTLPLALLCGPTFGIFYASMTMYGKSEAPPGTEATVQSLLAVAFEGLGAGAGSVIGGIAFDSFGSRATFLYSGIASFGLLAINVLLHIFVIRRNSPVTANTSANHRTSQL